MSGGESKEYGNNSKSVKSEKNAYQWAGEYHSESTEDRWKTLQKTDYTRITFADVHFSKDTEKRFFGDLIQFRYRRSSNSKTEECFGTTRAGFGWWKKLK